MKYVFPENFWWGSASSALQSEGEGYYTSRGETTWDHWFARQPHRFHQEIGPQDTSQFYRYWQEDIQLLKQLNHNSFRTSLSWARLIPDGIGEVNPEAVTFYNQVINELIEQGITPFITLFHFDMPMAMQEIGGWENREVVDAYARYAKICFELFGDRVLHWFTFNEPIVPVEGDICMISIIRMSLIFAVLQQWHITLYWHMLKLFRHSGQGIMREKSVSF